MAKRRKRRSGLLSVVVPVYNEGENVNRCADTIAGFLAGNKIRYEIIFVDDGSADDSWERIKLLNERDGNVFGVGFSRNFGKESAIIAGLAEASGECVVVIDCDLQHPPNKIVEMYGDWQDGYDVVEGVKSNRGKEGAIKKIGAKFFYSVMNSITRIDMSNASDFKLLDKTVVSILLSMPEKDFFFRALSSWTGCKSIAIEYDVDDRRSGGVKMGGWKAG